jgi:Tol biopolymer transport system component
MALESGGKSMALAPGFRLGPYEILSPLGAGGMGEVYKARDTRLERSVAVKVLPPNLSSSPEARQRFEREAKTISQLSHPHICSLYDVGHEGETEYLVMELLEGETLSDRLARGSLPLEQTLRYGQEIADALDKAHRQGIVHRDLKPGNVMLTKSGVKLLDFGLAKAMAPAAPQSSLTALPTQQGLTQEGTILGTFQYMAPEQLEGKEADGRTDIFAFGAVLYEMATGKKAFSGTSQASLISSIMKEEPASISTIQPMTPLALDRVVKTCLAKDPEERWQSASDLKRELRWLAEGSQAGAGTALVARRRPGGRLSRAAIAVALVGLGAGAALLLRPRPTPPGAIRMSLVAPPGITVSNEPSDVVISPDGSTIAIVATDAGGLRRIWLRPLDALTPQPVPGTDGATTPFWSPDGGHIAFFAAGKLRRTARTGGTAETLADAPNSRGGAWGRGDVIVFAPTSGGPLLRIAASGGATSPATRLDEVRGEKGHRFPSFLPDGRRFLYGVIPQTESRVRIRLGTLEGAPTPGPDVALASNGAVFAAPGYVLYGRLDSVVAQPFDPDAGRVTGPAIPIREVPNVIGQAGAVPPVSVSTGGVLVQSPSSLADTRLVWLDRAGQITAAIPAPPGSYNDLSISPDGSRVLAVRSFANATEIWQIEAVRGVATRMTFARPFNYTPAWSPDGHRFVFASDAQSGRNLHVRDASGAGAEDLLVKFDSPFNDVNDWSSDGSTLVIRRLDPQTGEDLWLAPAKPGGKPAPFLRTPFNERDGRLSPDGRWIAYRSDESGRSELYVQPFPSGGAKVRVSTDGAGAFVESGNAKAVWTRDGNELIFLGGDGVTVMSAAIRSGATLEIAPPKPLFKLPAGTVDGIASPDGSRYLASVTEAGTLRSMALVVLNWTAEVVKK